VVNQGAVAGAMVEGKRLVMMIPGDGIGLKCVAAAQRIIEATGVPLA